MEITAILASARPEPLVGASVAASPDATATQQFAALMQAPAAGAAPDPAAVAPADAALAANHFHSVGDRILHGMHSASTEMRSAWNHVSDMLNADTPTLSMQEMLSLQLYMTQASMQFEMVGKAVSRSSQNFDQLVRLQ